ncbi:MAG: hypothetical protein B6242_11125 [Anaerolineaceae bacterium 4572_78]|nr:MAG: hypothetical protein B6242_11125 [Anaerolineaceae bacterium 4572_78]
MSQNIPLSEYATDTMGLILYLEKRRLPQKIKAIFRQVEQGQATMHIPAFVFAEIMYLSQKERIQISMSDVKQYLKKYINFHECPLNFATIQVAHEIDDIPELHDRLIAATAKYLEVTLITNDPIIQKSSHVQTIWK